MKKILLILLIFPLGIFSQTIFPVEISMELLSNDTIKLIISDSTEAFDIHDSNPSMRCAVLSLWIVGDSVIKADLDQRVFGYVTAEKNETVPQNIRFEIKKNQTNFNLFLYYETVIFGPKLYYLGGHFSNISANSYSGFIPENMNLIENSEREFSYYYGEKNSWFVVSAVRNGHKIGPNIYKKWGSFGELDALQRDR